MTAIPAVTSSSVKVFSLVKPSYVARFHHHVQRALFDPFAPGLVACFKDLLGRVVVLALALPGYVLAALLSIPSRAGTAIAAPRPIQFLCTHDQNPDVFLLSGEILNAVRLLCRPDNLVEADILYHGNLDAEKNEIDQKMQDPRIQELIAYINQRIVGDTIRESASKNRYKLPEVSREWALASLFVVLGIKPVLVFEQPQCNSGLISILKKISIEHLVVREAGHTYFVNERPLKAFDPRHFLTEIPGNSLTEAAVECFPNQDQILTDQVLSYLLGFGPSWEAYANNCSYLKQKHSVQCLLNEQHYDQIGKVLSQSFFKDTMDRSVALTLGCAYHDQAARIFKQEELGRNLAMRKSWDIYLSKILFVLQETGTCFFFDGLTARTDYFRKSFALKKWVMETYFAASGHNPIHS